MIDTSLRATSRNPSRSEVAGIPEMFATAAILYRQRKFIEAEGYYKSILKREPECFEALLYLGASLTERKELNSAISILKQAARANPNSIDAHTGLARAYKEHGQFRQALRCMERTLEIRPAFSDAHNECGILLIALEQPSQALDCYRKALSIRPNYVEAEFNCGNALVKLCRYDEALAHYERVLIAHPTLVDALHNKGNVLRTLQRYQEALACYELVTRYQPQHLAAQLGCAKMLELLRHTDSALARYRLAIKLAPSSAEAHFGAGSMLQVMGLLEEARQCYEQAVKLKDDLPGARSMLAFLKMCCCMWSDGQIQKEKVLRDLKDKSPLTLPWLLFSITDSPDEQHLSAQRWADTYFPMQAPLWRGEEYRHSRIRIAYLSADFHMHATSLLLAGVFEHHDRDRFEIIAVSFGPTTSDAMRTRLEAAFDRFIEVSLQTDLEVASLLREMEVDIAIDLKGYTTDSRSGILAHRPAPVQVNYLGYPGTMGTKSIDYLIADQIVIPPEDCHHYSETVVYLPGSYQANDRSRKEAVRLLNRNDAGLPERGFVFCCFNNNFKISPNVFDIWMRLLVEVDDSVLWLLEDNDLAAKNLRDEARQRGVDAARLVFAPRVSQEQHLARHLLADLFLDTLPCNAHTTASDALWAGLPIVTCLGKTFAGRVCASLLHATQLPELVTTSLAQYEQLALTLAKEPLRLTGLRSRLIAHRDAFSLFDTQRFTLNLERAYAAMLESKYRGIAGDGFIAV